MSNALATVDLTQLPSCNVNESVFDKLSQGTSFLGRLQLFSKGDAINEGLIPPGTYGIPESDKKIIKLGPEIDVLPLCRRPKALDMSDKSAIITNYDGDSETFLDIAARSEEQDSGCMYGTTFLIYERQSGRFLEFFCGTKSTRPVASEIAPFLPLTQADIDARKANGKDVSQLVPHFALPMTLKVRLAKNKRGHSWHVPEVQECALPFSNLPPFEQIVAEINKFLTMKTDGVEQVKEQPGKKTRAR